MFVHSSQLPHRLRRQDHQAAHLDAPPVPSRHPQRVLRNHQTQNVYGDGIDYWSPTVNMQRDPRWGRNQEVVSARLCRKLWHPLLR